jgi:class 3 adenylate cyclase/tetratricopeptide (TPR) repeat protein
LPAPQGFAPNAMICRICGFDNSKDARFCSMCGSSLGLHCPRCGKENPSGYKFCGHCGAPIGEEDERSEGPAQVVTGRAADASEASAERRQMTVMFCDLVGSVALAERLDPEELRKVIREYQASCNRIIAAHEGYVARYMGDGILTYFCYPQAHEDDAVRAVRAGLEIVRRIQTLGLHTRIGIHTGLVVVDEMKAGGRLIETGIVGRTPNIAARLQNMASPDTVLMSSETYRLVKGFVNCASLGLRSLKGIGDSVEVYQAMAESAARDRLEAEPDRILIPLVGRDREIGLLLERWKIAASGRGQVVMVSGEAGIGKSRLIQTFQERIEDEPHVTSLLYCSAHSQNSPLYPLIVFLAKQLELDMSASDEGKLMLIEVGVARYRSLPADAVPLIAELLSVPLGAGYPALELAPKVKKERMLAAVTDMLLESAAEKPLLVVVEDLHWVDPSTIEFLELLLIRVPLSRVLVLLSSRGGSALPDTGTPVTTITLPLLVDQDAEMIMDFLAHRKELPAEVVRHVIEKSDGNPLFVEELTKAVLELDLLKESGSSYVLQRPLGAFSIPITLQDSLMARLDRMGTARKIAQAAATIGRSFSREVLKSVIGLDDNSLDRELDRLVKAGVFYRRGGQTDGTYSFAHALLQEAAYHSLLHGTRQEYHRHIAESLETRFPEIPRLQPEVLAHHYTEAAISEKAAHYWLEAGKLAIKHSANIEAASHLRRGIEVCKLISPQRKQERLELNFQSLLGSVLAATEGYADPQTAGAYMRARVLCQEKGLAVHLIPALTGLWGFHCARGQLSEAEKVARECLQVAEKVGNPRFMLHAHQLVGATMFFLGEFLKARTHLERAVTFYREMPPLLSAVQEPIVDALSYLPTILWILGQPERSLAVLQEAHAAALKHSQPFNIVFANFWAARLFILRREPPKVREYAEATRAWSNEKELKPILASLSGFAGWALVKQGRGKDALSQIKTAIEEWRGTGAQIHVPYYLGALADGYRELRMMDEGLEVLKEALELVEATGNRDYEADLYRLRGELLLQKGGDEAEVERHLKTAIDVSRRQAAKMFELRAATSLARLLEQQGRTEEAKQTLSEVYGWFSEGFDTVDLREARELLDAL